MIIAAVNYLNTLPFVYGIEQAGMGLRADLRVAVPSACADIIAAGEADISLVPVADIPRIAGGKIITDYCIGADGPVGTVALFSNSALPRIHTVYLDSHSRTSVRLVRILARERWGISPRWIDDKVASRRLNDGEALLAIGDKVFDMESSFFYKIDLAAEWKAHTGLPFVFAAWVARTAEGRDAAAGLNDALRFGTGHIAQSINGTWNREKQYDFDHAYDYLTHNIQFDLTEPKQKAMKLFWEKIITPG